MPFKNKETARAYHLAYYHEHKNEEKVKKSRAKTRRKCYLKNKIDEDNKSYERFLEKRKNPTPLELNQLYFFDQELIKKKINFLIKERKETDKNFSLKEISRSLPIHYQSLLRFVKKKNIAKKSTIIAICDYLGINIDLIILEKTKR